MTIMRDARKQVDGQLDIYEVIDLVESEGLKPDCPAPLTRAQFMGDDEPDDGLSVERGPLCTFWVVDRDGKRLHSQAFNTQVESWAFIVGWRLAKFPG